MMRGNLEGKPNMIKGLHHIQITIPKGAEDQAREFYCRLMGLREIEKPANLKVNGGFWLEMPGLQLHIGVIEDRNEELRREHLAYHVEDLEPIKRRLEKAGLPLKEGLPIPGMKRFESRDPFGNRLEFVQLVTE